MKFMMYIPGMPFDGNTIKDGQSLGGSETAGYYIAKGMAEKGHSVFVFANLPKGEPAKIDGVNYLPIGTPSQNAPYGDNFLRHATSMPHDVLLAQRAPGIFGFKYNSKMNLWWSHDLALRRFLGNINQMTWNVDKFLTVSKFHKKQVAEVYGINDEWIDVLPNGVDLSLYQEPIDVAKKIKSKLMLYSSRPERGLVNLVKPGGVMEQLWEYDREIKLLVCSYENTTPDSAQMYGELYQACANLPNVQNVGHLSKQALATLQSNIWVHAYPTSFEETSCITAMEESAAGTPFVSMQCGALPETLDEGGVVWATDENFVQKIKNLSRNPEHWEKLHRKALKKAKSFGYAKVVDEFEEKIYSYFEEKTRNKAQLIEHFLFYSDIVAASKVGGNIATFEKDFDFFGKTPEETTDLYEDVADYNFEIGNKHCLGQFEIILAMPRMAPVIDVLKEMPEGSRILDFGCCVGQVTYAMQNAFPHLHFDGCDISEGQIKVAKEFQEQNKQFAAMDFRTAANPGDIEKEYDAIFAMEILEHIHDHKAFMIGLEKLVKPGGRILFTTPVGVTDSISPEKIREHGLHVKAHLHHFEEQDVLDMVEHKPGFEIFFARMQDELDGEKRGSFIWWYNADDQPIKEIDYNRKKLIQAPRQGVSCCIICRNDGDALAKTLKSVQPFVDEFVIAIDGEMKGGNAYAIARKYNATIFNGKSPLQIGFDEARNETLKHATKEWILWLDDDEDFKWPHRIKKYLRPNQYDSYALHHLHFTVDPSPVLMKDDLPARMFRNRKGIQFFGVVHEHPEKALNEGPGMSWLIPHHEGCIAHGGYDTEETRRNRFKRNWPLMVRDREKYPARKLGRFLWIRDLAHVNRFRYEETGVLEQQMIDYARTAIEAWRQLLAEKEHRLAVESLPYLTESVALITQNGGYHFKLGLEMNLRGYGDEMKNGSVPGFIEGRVETREDLLKLMELIADEKAKPLEDGQKYI